MKRRGTYCSTRLSARVSLRGMEDFEQVVEGWKHGGGKEKEKRGHNSRRRKKNVCVSVCFIAVAPPTPPSC